MPGSDASVWANEGTAFSFTGDDINFDEAGDKAMYSSVTFTGDFTFEAIYGINTTDHANMGFYPISEDATFTTNSIGGMGSMTNSWYMRADGTIKHAATTVDTLTPDTTSIIKFERVSDTVKIYKGGVLEHTWTQTTTAEVRMVVGNGGAAASARFVDFIYNDNSTSFKPKCVFIG